MERFYSMYIPDCEGTFRDIGIEIGGESDLECKETASFLNSTGWLEKRAEQLIADYLPDWEVTAFTICFSERITRNFGWFRCDWKRVNGRKIPTNTRITLSYRLCHYYGRDGKWLGLDQTWIIDSVIFHEICHHLTPGQHHSAEFKELCQCYPLYHKAHDVLNGRFGNSDAWVQNYSH